MRGLDNIYRIYKCSQLEKDVYRALSKKQRTTALQVSLLLNRPKESVHRALNTLERKGLVRRISGRPCRWYALPYETIVQDLVGSIYGGITITSQVETPRIDLPFTFISNREMHHRLGMKLFGESKKEVLGIASGRGDLHPEYYKVMVEAIKKGIEYRYISLHYDKENKERLENWKRNGFIIKYLSGENLNLIVYDRKIVQFGLRLAEGSREKIGMIIENESFGKFMGEFFDSLWEKAEEV